MEPICAGRQLPLAPLPHEGGEGISPASHSLGPDHAEYKNYKQEIPQDLWSFQTKPNYFDFWEISKKQLNGCGISEKNIEISCLCTVCNKNDYFSYRADKKTGRNVTIAALKG